jgi:hypothetical protein
MVNPLKDIIIGTGLGVTAAMFWKNFKNSEMSRIDSYYKWYDLQQAKKAASSGDDDDE